MTSLVHLLSKFFSYIIFCIHITDKHCGRRPKTRDYRTRRDRNERRNQVFAKQLPALAAAYMNWRSSVGDEGFSGEYKAPEGVEAQGQGVIMEVDLFRMSMLLLL
jgi:hypothetical protein